MQDTDAKASLAIGPGSRDSRPARPDTLNVRNSRFEIALKFLLALVSAAITFILTDFTGLDRTWRVQVTILIAGMVLLGDFLRGLTRRVDTLTTQLDYVGATTESIGRQRDTASEQFSLFVRYVEERLPTIVAQAVDNNRRQESSIRELAHSLNSPFAQMEAALILLTDSENNVSAELQAILESVRICKSFLLTFREIATLTEDSQSWDADSIARTLTAGAQLYMQSELTSQKISVQMPHQVSGYSNNYIVEDVA